MKNDTSEFTIEQVIDAGNRLAVESGHVGTLGDEVYAYGVESLQETKFAAMLSNAEDKVTTYLKSDEGRHAFFAYQGVEFDWRSSAIKQALRVGLAVGFERGITEAAMKLVGR